jgi:hypothetical protein
MHSQPYPDRPTRDALRQAAADLDAAEAGGQPYAMTQALAQLGRSYRGIGALEAAEASCEQALRWSHLVGAVDLTVGLLCDLCDIATAMAERLDDGDIDSGRGHTARARARDHAFEASRCAGGLGDARWEVDALLRISDALDRCGDRDDAIALQTRAMRLIAGESPADALMMAGADC